MTSLLLGWAVFGLWLYLLFGRGGFWLTRVRDDVDEPVISPPWLAWPRLVAVIPARDEAEGIGRTVTSLLKQDYAGQLSIILVDDDSKDGTADVARKAAEAVGGASRLTVLRGQALPPGWTGKLWAVKQGVGAANLTAPDYLLLTDADIVYEPDVVRRLVARAQDRGYVLTSLMVKLRCESIAEQMLIPAFVFFFQMLYPFESVNKPRSRVAAAAGGCMLIRPDVLARAGGIDAIRTALIDDCSLAAKMKEQGPIWLGLTQRAHSIRPYPHFGDIRRMVSRSAYAQLRYSPWLLLGTVLGMLFTYFAAPLLVIFGNSTGRLLGLATYFLMVASFQPTLRFYRQSPWWGFALPLIALVYVLYTLDSAYQHLRGRGGAWKGRVQAHVAEQS